MANRRENLLMNGWNELGGWFKCGRIDREIWQPHAEGSETNKFVAKMG